VTPNSKLKTQNSKLLLATALLLGFAATSGAETVNKILATVDGDPVTVVEVQKFIVTKSRGQEIPAEIRADSPQVLDAYITEKLIQKEISDQGIVVTDADIDRYIDGIRAQNKLTLERLKQAVEMQGMSWETYRAQVREELLKAQLINREVRGKVNVTPEEVQRYYQEHKGEFVSTGEQVKVLHILISVPSNATDAEAAEAKKQAEKLAADIDDADDFQKAAKDLGDDTGGDLGYLNPNSMQEQLGTAVKKLKVGEVSEPIATPAGFHLVMVEEIKEGADTPVDEFSEDIKQKLYNEAIEERYDRWLREDLRQRHYVDIRP
jgi:peptidyl-prolyl cis-trans isomerase SurA